MLKKAIIITVILLAILINFNPNFIDASEVEEDFYESEFLVGFIELYLGMNTLDGDLELIEDSDRYQERINIGRANFYLRGKIKGEYLLTAWLDTKEESLGDILTNLNKREQVSPFEKIDAEKYYPVYGDNSYINSEVDTAGRVYIKLESDELNAIWGNTRLNLDDNYLIDYRRNIYGASINYNSDFSVNAYWYQPFSAQVRDELELTGGILYYLSQEDLVAGSETIRLELRDSNTDRVIESKELQAGRDYEINYLQGRIVLKSNLYGTASNNLIIDEDGENKFYLIANYQHEYDSTDMTDSNYGLETGYDITDNLHITANYHQENHGDGDDYILRGLNLVYGDSDRTDFRVDYSDSKNLTTGTYFSSDGGINYERIELKTGERAQAWNLEYDRVLTEDREIELSTYYTYREAGFNSGSYYTENDRTNYGLSLVQENDQMKNRISYARVINGDAQKDIYDLGLDRQYNPETDYEIELKYRDERPAEEPEARSLTGALGIDHQYSENIKLYGSQQLTLYRNDAAERNNITTLGGEVEQGKWRYTAEGSAGDRNRLAAGAGYSFSEDTEFYTELARRFDDDSTETTVGGRSQLSDGTSLTAEHRFVDSKDRTTNSNVLGLDYLATDNLVLSLDYTRSEIRPADSENFTRDIVGGSVNYTEENFRTANRFEYRVDDKEDKFEQIVLKSDSKLRHNEELDFIYELEYSREKQELIDKYLEGTFGIAYHPREHDRVNYLFKYSHINQENRLGSDSLREPGDYAAEKSRVVSLDTVFDVNPEWRITSKFAFKDSMIKANSFEESWSRSQTYLWTQRLQHALREDIDVFAEYRTLGNSLASDRKWGFLVGGYKQFDNNTKIGLGYNFTDFNDDLTNLNYNARGLFLNIIKAW